MTKYFLVLCTFCQLTSLFSQQYPQDQFISPLTVPLYLSGSFAELRTNHFHSGIDIKTNGQEGLSVIAVADGYVSRIRVLAAGFGKVLYLTHENGYTSVYAHLSRFEESLDEYVKSRQYIKESFEIELFPPKDKFVFKKGDTIAFSGNSGYSMGAHLHFEIRETTSEAVLNPLLFGIQVIDNLKPELSQIKIYPLDPGSVIQIDYYGRNAVYSKTYTQAVTLKSYLQQGVYKLSGIKEIRVFGKIGLAIESIDKMDASHNKLGLVEMFLIENDKEIFSCRRERFEFHQTRFINAHIDYEEKIKTKKVFERLYNLPFNELPFYNQGKDGVILLNEGDTNKYKVVLKDFYENTS